MILCVSYETLAMPQATCQRHQRVIIVSTQEFLIAFARVRVVCVCVCMRT